MAVPLPRAAPFGVYLADRDIRQLLPELGITGPDEGHPFDPDDQIQPCSVDLRVSTVFWKASRRPALWRRVLRREIAIDLRRSDVHDLDPRRDWRRSVLNEGDVLTIRPGELVLGRIYESLRIPDSCAGRIEGRSSFARLGLAVHCTGDFINPGWNGYMPLQLHNVGPYPVRIAPYTSLCQLMLIKLSSEPEHTYGDTELRSKYVNDDGGPSLWWRDRQIEKLRDRLAEVDAGERLQQQIIALVRFESPDVLERFQRHVQSRRLEQVENVDDVLDGFGKREDWRRRRDRAFRGSFPVVGAGGALSVVFGQPAVWQIALAVVLVAASLTAAWLGTIWRDAGYLGKEEIEDARNRPQGGTP